MRDGGNRHFKLCWKLAISNNINAKYSIFLTSNHTSYYQMIFRKNSTIKIRCVLQNVTQIISHMFISIRIGSFHPIM